MDIIEVNGIKYSRQVPVPESGVFRPILTVSKPINIIKPLFVCKGDCDKCKDIKCFTI